MTDPTNASGPPTSPYQKARRNRGLVLILAIVVIAGLTGAFVTQAISQEDGLGPWHGGWHHGGLMSGPLDPASVEQHADRMVRHLAIEIDATPEQQDQLRTIISGTMKDILPTIEQARAAHQQAHELLIQPAIDRAALEKFRSEQIALLDEASKQIMQALADAAEVMTPEQRQKLGELLAQGGGHPH